MMRSREWFVADARGVFLVIEWVWWLVEGNELGTYLVG